MRPLLLASSLLVACGGSAEQNAKYPPRKEGCEVMVYPETPSGNTDNIGPVSSTCDQDVSDDDCLRTLKDEACKLGADVVWGVDPEPKLDLGKKTFSGRAAHTK